MVIVWSSLKLFASFSIKNLMRLTINLVLAYSSPDVTRGGIVVPPVELFGTSHEKSTLPLECRLRLPL